MFWNYLVLYKKSSTTQSVGMAGFGLVELMVSISIMAIIASIIFVRQESFNGSVLLRSEAYNIALHLREVQLSAVASIGIGAEFRSVQGLHFDSTAGINGYYYSFKDSNGNSYYDGPAEQYNFQGKLDPRFEIRAIWEDNVLVHNNNLSIVFERPNFDPRFFGSNGLHEPAVVKIDIARRGSLNIRTVEITATGQISVL